MDPELVREQLYRRYIEPTRKKRENYVGIEIEMPIVNLAKEAVDFEVVHQITHRFMEHFRFQESHRDEEGNVCSVSENIHGDILSYDCSYNNLELSMGKEKELFALEKRFSSYYSFLQNEFQKYHHTLTGMGVNPYRIYNHNVPIPNGRYRMLFHHLNSYKRYALPMYFHNYPEFGTFSSASQVQLDVNYEDLLLTIGAFSLAEPIKALLFSNSVLLDEHEELLCCRDMFWENSTHGINPHNVGMFADGLESEEDLLSYIESTSIYCVERGDKYINFTPINIVEYFNRPRIEGEYYENGRYRKIRFEPSPEDIRYLRTFKFEDLTFRGTIEYRSICCQPIKDAMTVAAFHLGLKNRLHELYTLLKNDHVIYHHGYTAGELRKMFVRKTPPSFVNKIDLFLLVEKVLRLGEEGLRERGLGEEVFLKPLFERMERQTNPAKEMLDLREQGVPLEDIILSYGQLN